MRNFKTNMPIMLVLTLLLAIPCILSCTQQAAPAPVKEVKPEKIVIPLAIDLSGPYGQQNQWAINGVTDAFAYVNSTGGIKGVPLEFISRDDAGSPSNALTVYNEFKNMKPKPAMVAFLDSQVGVALKQRFNEDQIVNMMGEGSGPGLYPSGYTFAISTENRDKFAFFCDWLAEKEAPNHPKVAILTWDNVYGNVILQPVCLDYAKSKGIDIVATELFNVTDVNASAQLQRIKQSGAKWIYTNTLLIGPAVIAKTTGALNVTQDFNYGVAGVSLNYITMQISGGMEGWVGPSNWASWDESDVKGVQVMEEQFKKNKRTADDKQNVHIGAFICGLLIQQTLNSVVDKYGWDGITGPNVKAILENTGNFEAMGLTKISFSKDLRSPVYCKMYQISQGKILPITGWKEAHHFQ